MQRDSQVNYTSKANNKQDSYSCQVLKINKERKLVIKLLNLTCIGHIKYSKLVSKYLDYQLLSILRVS